MGVLPTYVPRVNEDGNETSGVPSVQLQAPLGTYLGWNTFRAGVFAGHGCGFQGGWIPFAKTKAERSANRDPRLSLEERYGTHDGYVAVVRKAAEQAVKDHGLTARARIHHLSVRGDDPVWMLTGPIRATRHALEKSGMGIDDIDLFECNEAFASVVLAWMQELDVPHEKVNVNGGGIALGHPIGATGTRLMTTLLSELERTGGRYGLQVMCEGGGQANVTIIERL